MEGNAVDKTQQTDGMTGQDGAGTRRGFVGWLRTIPTGNRYWAILGVYGFLVSLAGALAHNNLPPVWLERQDNWNYIQKAYQIYHLFLGAPFSYLAVLILFAVSIAYIIVRRRKVRGIALANTLMFFALPYSHALLIAEASSGLMGGRWTGDKGGSLPYIEGGLFAVQIIAAAVLCIGLAKLRRQNAGFAEMLLYILIPIGTLLWVLSIWGAPEDLGSC